MYCTGTICALAESYSHMFRVGPSPPVSMSSPGTAAWPQPCGDARGVHRRRSSRRARRCKMFSAANCCGVQAEATRPAPPSGLLWVFVPQLVRNGIERVGLDDQALQGWADRLVILWLMTSFLAKPMPREHWA